MDGRLSALQIEGVHWVRTCEIHVVKILAIDKIFTNCLHLQIIPQSYRIIRHFSSLHMNNGKHFLGGLCNFFFGYILQNC